MKMLHVPVFRRLSLATILLLVAGSAWAGSAATEAQHFLNEAVQGSVAEVSLGQLAEDKAQDPAVREFGTRMVNDHSKTLTKARQLAGEHGVRLLEQMDSKQKQQAEKLAARSSAEVDRAYLQAMVENHRTTVQHSRPRLIRGAVRSRHLRVSSYRC